VLGLELEIIETALFCIIVIVSLV